MKKQITAWIGSERRRITLKVLLFLTECLIPLLMLSFGLLWKYRPPTRRNPWYGYRTTNSCRSEETWKFAHAYLGASWRRWGCILLLFSVVLFAFAERFFPNRSGLYSVLWITIQTLGLIITIFPAEKELKRRFDPQGKPILPK